MANVTPHRAAWGTESCPQVRVSGDSTSGGEVRQRSLASRSGFPQMSGPTPTTSRKNMGRRRSPTRYDRSSREEGHHDNNHQTLRALVLERWA